VSPLTPGQATVPVALVGLEMNICYPDGRLKCAGWGTLWVDGTAKLIFSESEMDDDQRSCYRGTHRWSGKSKWKYRPTLVRRTVIGADEAICSVREFPEQAKQSNCTSPSNDRGRVLRVLFHVSLGGKRGVVELGGESMLNTSVLIINREAMTPSEMTSFDGQPNAVVVRRQISLAAQEQKEFELICCDSVTDTDAAIRSFAACRRRDLAVPERG
jgi:hypothetical protein